MDKSVLLVEDNPDEILLARRAFARAGLGENLRIAEGGEAACRLLLQDGGDALPALVLLDWQMPGMDGLAVLRALRQARPQSAGAALPPVVILSSSDDPGDIAAAYAAGANSYLRKPVDFEIFAQLVSDLHRYWLTHNVLPVAQVRT
ncbi:response regulator [Janthinobacterium sp. 17J80-10]|uniref:response regulator n=1 Tax=Janthinobacterium sp. 17J80-10 TaxID=2497863 RepID=UPI0010053284|nr:response regulator [Janthinobacterium sp. 17J80-10]QAU33237.1 response regulator [Janthinobacterium sp. 17J80-10]